MLRQVSLYAFLLLLVETLAFHDPATVRRRHEWHRTVALFPSSSSASPSSPTTLQLEGDGNTPLLLRQEGTGAEKRLDEDVEETEGNITITKELLTGLLQEVLQYLREDHLLVLYPQGDRDLCVGAARALYRQGQTTSCRPRSSTPTDSPSLLPAVVYLAAKQDRKLEFPGLWAGVGDDGPHLVLVLPHTPTGLFLAPSPPINLCVIYPRGEALMFAEVFTFAPEGGRETEPLVGKPVWAWVPGRATHEIPPYRGDILAPKDFMGHVVRVAVIKARPYVIMNRGKGGVLRPRGYLVDILKALQLQLNFTIRWVEAKDGQFGLPSANGSWTGLVGVLHKNEADVALAALSLLQSRAAVMDFSPAVDYLSVRVVVYTASKGETIDWLLYTNVFHWSVWAALVGVWVTASVGVVVVSTPEPDLTVPNYLFSFIGAYAQQGSEVQPVCGRGRMVFWGLWAGSVLTYASYTALLTSRLAVVHPSKPFNDLYDAITSAGYSIAVQSGTAILLLMQTSRDAGLQLVYRRLQENPQLLVPGNDEGIDLVKNGGGKIGYLQEVNTINYDLNGDCSFSWEGPSYYPEYTYLGYRKNLPYANVFSAYIAKAADTGILHKLRTKWWKADTSSCASSTQVFMQMGFSKVVFAFFVLGTGIVAGWMVLLVEMWIKRFFPSTSPSITSSSSSSSSSSSASSFVRQVLFGRRRKRHWDEETGRKVTMVKPYLPHLKHLPPRRHTPVL